MKVEYQVFITFKNLDESGNKTPDSIIAEDLYKFLSNKGLKVFFSNISLEKLGEASIKRAIDDALDSSLVLVAVGTSIVNLNSGWVRYEWESFFEDIDLNEIKPNGRIFTYIDESMNIKKLPRSLRKTQVIYHGHDSFERLYRFIANGMDSDDSLCFNRISGPGPDKFIIAKGTKKTVGKHRDNDVVLNLRQISRHHAEIIHNEDGLFVNDLGSKNGTFVNNERIESKSLKPDDVVEFDIIKYQVRYRECDWKTYENV